MELAKHWKTVQQLVQQATQSAFHLALSTVDKDNNPWVTPIGSLLLRDDYTGYYFEKFPKNLSKNLELNKRVAVLAINSDPQFWVQSLGQGTFETPPGVRLAGTASDLRIATAEELDAWHQKMSFAAGTKGYDILWKDMKMVRDIAFDEISPVHCGEMTLTSWELPD